MLRPRGVLTRRLRPPRRFVAGSAAQGDDDDYDDEATDVLRTPQFRGPSLGIASAAPSVKAAAAAAATAAAATPGAALATAASKTHKAKFNSTSSLYIYSTIMKPDIQEIVFCVAIVLLDRISEGEEALALRRAEAAEAASGGGGDDGGAGASDGSEVPEFFRSPLGVPSRRLDVLREGGGGDGAPAGSETAGADGADGAGGAGAGGDGGAAATGEGEGEGELTEAAIFRAVKTIHERAELSSEVLVIALLFIERLRQLASLPLLLCNWQPVLVTALLVAQKVRPRVALARASSHASTQAPTPVVAPPCRAHYARPCAHRLRALWPGAQP